MVFLRNIFRKQKSKEIRRSSRSGAIDERTASRRELRASTSRGGCHLLRRCRVHRPSRFAPDPAPVGPRLVFPRREIAPLRFESRRVHSAAITRVATSEACSSILVCNGIVHLSSTPISAKNYGECNTKIGPCGSERSCAGFSSNSI